MNKKDREIAEDSFRIGCEEAAKKYGISTSAIKKLRRLFRILCPRLYSEIVAKYGQQIKTAHSFYSPEEKIRACEIAINSSVKEAAKETGYREDYITLWLDQITSPDFQGFRSYSEEEKKEILDYANKNSIRLASERFGCCVTTIRKWRKRIENQNNSDDETSSDNDIETSLRNELLAARTREQLWTVEKKLKNEDSLSTGAYDRLYDLFYTLNGKFVQNQEEFRSICDEIEKELPATDNESEESVTAKEEPSSASDIENEEEEETNISSNYSTYEYRKIVRHSLEHSAEETAKRYNITVDDVNELRTRFCKEFRNEYREKIATYSFINGIGKTMVEFKISDSVVGKCRDELKERCPKKYGKLIRENGIRVSRAYSPEDKARGVEIGLAKSKSEAAKEIGCSPSLIHYWIKQASLTESKGSDVTTNDNGKNVSVSSNVVKPKTVKPKNVAIQIEPSASAISSIEMMKKEIASLKDMLLKLLLKNANLD